MLGTSVCCGIRYDNFKGSGKEEQGGGGGGGGVGPIALVLSREINVRGGVVCWTEGHPAVTWPSPRTSNVSVGVRLVLGLHKHLFQCFCLPLLVRWVCLGDSPSRSDRCT